MYAQIIRAIRILEFKIKYIFSINILSFCPLDYYVHYNLHMKLPKQMVEVEVCYLYRVTTSEPRL